jgi:opacity protein-like surface antigen
MCKSKGPAHAGRILSVIAALAFAGAAPAIAQSGAGSGFYVGAGIGAVSGDNETREVNGSRAYYPKFTDATAGVFGGWQRNYGRWVVGGEAEIGYFDVDSRSTQAFSGGSVETSVKLGGYAAASARLGYAPSADWLIYGRAGLAVGELSGKTEQTCTGADLCGGAQSSRVSTATTKDTSYGYLLGAGIERRFAENWSTRFDYQYLSFRKELALPPAAGPGWNHQVDLHALKVGLVRRF